MTGEQIIRLAADLIAGVVTVDMIRNQFGDGVLSQVVGIVGGTAAGYATNALLNTVEEHTGIGSLADDVLSIF